MKPQLLTPAEYARLELILPTLPITTQNELLRDLRELDLIKSRRKARINFLEFVRLMWPGWVFGRHHEIMASAFERVAAGKLNRLIINMPPRFSKSEMASYLLPAWYLGRYPGKKVIECSNTADLAVGFGRKVRNLVDTQDFQRVFPGVSLAADSKAAGKWSTNRGGEYFAIGTGGAVTGKGADLLIIDDPHSEQEAVLAATNPAIFDQVYDWYTSGPRQRLQPNGSIVIVATRWAKRDLPGQILKASMTREGSDEWEVIQLPALLPSGNSLWPEFWPTAELEATRANLPLAKWNAQYQQEPISEGGAIVKREWWKTWREKDPPPCEFIIQSWDTAFLKTQRADFNACTVWGVFFLKPNEEKIEDKQPNIILLNALQKRMEFPELKRVAKEEYDYWEPDSLIIESKAAGLPLIFELRRMGIPVQEFSPSRGNDKIARLNAVADMFSSGMVWAPETRWAEEVMEQVAEFPNGEHDDLVDCTSQALLRFRQGGFLRVPSDQKDEKVVPFRRVEYY